MYKVIIFAILFATFANAQTKPAPGGKKPTGKNDKSVAKKDSLKTEKEPEVYVEPVIPHEFLVYTKKPRKAKDRTKLCINLVSDASVINYCMNDSLCKDPEVYKILFEQRQGDTLYVLIFIDAFTKIDATNDDGRCNAGKETKLVFAKWDTKTNQAKWKQKNISSCSKGITNMTKEPILSWDKSSVLTINYHRGLSFYEIKFDPQQYQLGLQNNSGTDSESKSAVAEEEKTQSMPKTTLAEEKTTNPKPAGKNKETEKPVSTTKNSEPNLATTQEEKKETAVSEQPAKKLDYVLDSTYVNGVLQVKKRKIKNK